ncbi:MAG TPA: threonine synthase [Methylomirabilota bacterium]|nr:threonine synthase [Methylomirabilota bacterium]
MSAGSTLTDLECSKCGKRAPASTIQNLCSCGKPLFARYDLRRAAASLKLGALAARPKNLWRYEEVLPGAPPLTLGEGMTPLLPAKRLGAGMGMARLYVKDEALNPTGSFKARGMAVAVAQAKHLGAKVLAAPTAGNAGGALAAYAAAAGLKSVIVMPADTPQANQMECRAFGAQVVKLDGLISDCGRYVAERKQAEGWFDVSTLKEPYRVEGKKTMGYELWEQFAGKLPDVILYPTGGGVGLIGMCKAFDEMQEMGWIGSERPRMVAVQASGCAPIVRAWEEGRETAEPIRNASTTASGLRVPGPLGDFLILRMLRQTHGAAIAVTDDEMLAAGRDLAEKEGIYAAPEGAATVAAIGKLALAGWVKPTESVVLFNTGTGYKYVEAWRQALLER